MDSTEKFFRDNFSRFGYFTKSFQNYGRSLETKISHPLCCTLQMIFFSFIEFKLFLIIWQWVSRIAKKIQISNSNSRNSKASLGLEVSTFRAIHPELKRYFFPSRLAHVIIALLQRARFAELGEVQCWPFTSDLRFHCVPVDVARPVK